MRALRPAALTTARHLWWLVTVLAWVGACAVVVVVRAVLGVVWVLFGAGVRHHATPG